MARKRRNSSSDLGALVAFVLVIAAIGWGLQNPLIAGGLIAIVVVLVLIVRELAPARPSPTAATSSDDDSRARYHADPEDRVGELPPGAVWLRPGNRIDVVGESHHRAAIVSALGRIPDVGINVKVAAALVAEPDNRYDSGAIAVYIGAEHVGYLSRADAALYRDVVHHLATGGRFGCCQAWVRGGWTQEDGSKADFGIQLFLAPPGAQFDLLRGLAEAEAGARATT